MTKIDGIKQEMRTMKDLEDLTNMLEQRLHATLRSCARKYLQVAPSFKSFGRCTGFLNSLRHLLQR